MPLAPPPVQEPRPAATEPALTGKRVIVASGFVDDPSLVSYLRGWRAASEVFNESGRDWVRIVPELDWFAWQADKSPDKPPRCPRAKAYPAQFVWAE